MTLFISVAILGLIVLSIGVLLKSYHTNPALGVIYLKFITGLAIIALVWRVKTLGVEWNSIWLFIAFFAVLVLSLMVLFASGHGLYWVLSTIFQR